VQAETKTSVDQIADGNGGRITVLRFSGDISSSSHDALLGIYQTVCSISLKSITSTPAASRW
jgi:hypothetical protein